MQRNIRRISGPLSIPAALGMLIAALLWPIAVHGQAAADGAMAGFQTFGDFELHIDGEAAPATIYRSNSARGMLLVSPRLEAPILIKFQDQSVSSVGFLKLDERPDGTVDLLPGAVSGSLGRFRVEGEGIAFAAGKLELTLEPKPYLVGFQPGENLKEHSPDYERRADAYSPSAPILDRLRAQGSDVRVQVFFGSWCPACGEMVPRMVRVAEELGDSKVKVEFYGLPRSFGDDPEAKRFGIRSVPTGVVFVGDREVGRITGNNWKIPELALESLLQGS